jgi:oligopeptidase B
MGPTSWQRTHPAPGRAKPSAPARTSPFSVDYTGRRFYTVQFKNLLTGETLGDTIPDITGNIAWANDNRTLFYTRQDPVTLRWHLIYRHVLGTDARQDVLVYDEKDETFSCSVSRTKSKKYVLIECEQTLSSEYRFLNADSPLDTFAVFLAREATSTRWTTTAISSTSARTTWQRTFV